MLINDPHPWEKPQTLALYSPNTHVQLVYLKPDAEKQDIKERANEGSEDSQIVPGFRTLTLALLGAMWEWESKILVLTGPQSTAVTKSRRAHVTSWVWLCMTGPPRAPGESASIFIFMGFSPLVVYHFRATYVTRILFFCYILVSHQRET